jgi:hypothetical protein
VPAFFISQVRYEKEAIKTDANARQREKEVLIDFASMQVGDKVKMPASKWGTENRQVYEQAAEYARNVTGDEIRPQFQVEGHDDGKGYWLERIR